AVLDYARDLELIDSTPIAAFRDQLRRRARTKSGRVASDANRHIRPIDDPGALAKLLAEAAKEGDTRGERREALAFVLLQLDGRLRQGEALGLRWGRIGWGVNEYDTTRHLLI